VPFGPDISWPYGFRQLDPESREVLESAYGTGPVYQQPAMDDYGYGDPGYSDPSYEGPKTPYGNPAFPPGNRNGHGRRDSGDEMPLTPADARELAERLRGGTSAAPKGGMPRRQSGGKAPLTPADVRNKQFSTTRLRPGYDEEEVDAFLDEVEADLGRLIQENEELRAELAERLRGGTSAVPALSSPLSGSRPAAAVGMEAERRQPAAAPRGGVPRSDTTARVTSLAQQTGEQATADARPSRSADPQASGRSDYPEQWHDDSRLDDRVPDGSRPADPHLEGMTYSERGPDGPEITASWPAQPAAGDLDSFEDFWRDDAGEEYSGLFGNREAESERADAKRAAARRADAKRAAARHGA